jgi:hypothetical protein
MSGIVMALTLSLPRLEKSRSPRWGDARLLSGCSRSFGLVLRFVSLLIAAGSALPSLVDAMRDDWRPSNGVTDIQRADGSSAVGLRQTTARGVALRCAEVNVV